MMRRATTGQDTTGTALTAVASTGGATTGEAWTTVETETQIPRTTMMDMMRSV